MAAPFLFPHWPLPCSSFPRSPDASPAKRLRAGCGHFSMGKALLRYRQFVRPDQKRGCGLSDSGHAGGKRAFPNPDETQRKDV